MWGTLWRVLDFIADVVLMHVLWVVTSLPVFTIGASTTALYYTAMRRVHQDRGTVFSNFKSSFKMNFKQSTIYWLALAASGALLAFDLNYTAKLDTTVGKAMFGACAVMMAIWWMVALYIFPVQAKFESTLFGNFKNALLLAIRHFPYTLLLSAIWVMLWILTALFPPFTGVLVICGAGFLSCLTSPVYVQIFRAYTHEDEEDTGDPDASPPLLR